MRNRTKILGALVAIEGEVIHYFKSHNLSKEFGHEAEKFKLKLEVIRLRFLLRKFEIKEEYQSLITEARSKIETLTSGRRKKMEELGNGVLDDFKDEISDAYRHIHKAVASLK